MYEKHITALCDRVQTFICIIMIYQSINKYSSLCIIEALLRMLFKVKGKVINAMKQKILASSTRHGTLTSLDSSDRQCD